MMNESERRELRRMLAEPPSGEWRDFFQPAGELIAAMIDTPYYPLSIRFTATIRWSWACA